MAEHSVTILESKERATVLFIDNKDSVFVFVFSGCCLDVPDYPFDEQYDSFAFNSLLTLPESIQAITKVRTECNRVSHTMSLYHIPTAKPMRLEEFEQAQSQATSQVPSKLFVCFLMRQNKTVMMSLIFSYGGMYAAKPMRLEEFEQAQSQATSHHHHHPSLNRKGWWGTTDDFTTSLLHFLPSMYLG